MKKISFLAADNIQLDGILYHIPEKTKKVIISVHGMASNCFKKRDDVIASYANSCGIDYFCFNNRGSELARYIYKEEEGKRTKKISGTSYENVLEGYEDILGAISAMKQLGYEEFYLQGHSLGCTKIVYTYNRLLEEERCLSSIKGIILLSMIDIPGVLKIFLNQNYSKYLEIAEQREKMNELMPLESFIHPISAKTFLRYARDNREIDFAGYGRDERLEILNRISSPLFMRWGNEKEMIAQQIDEMINTLKKQLKQENIDIGYIDGANHNYTDKEEILAKEIIEFIKDI